MFAIAQQIPANPFHTSSKSPLLPHNVNLPHERGFQYMSQPSSFQESEPKRLKQSSSAATASFSFSPSPSTFTSADSPNANSSTPPSHYAQRYAQVVNQPASKVRERGSREFRRNAFLNRVKRDRDGGKFDARSDQIQRMDYFKQWRRMEEMARSAPGFLNSMEEVDDENDTVNMEHDSGPLEEHEEALLDEYISQEDEYQAFVEETERNQTNFDHSGQNASCVMENEDETLLADLLSQIETEPQDAMDTSGA